MIRKLLLAVIVSLLSVASIFAVPSDEEVAVAFQKGDFNLAVSLLKKQLKKNPDNLIANFRLSVSQLFLRDFDNSLASINKAIKVAPEQNKDFLPVLYGSRASIYLNLKDTITAYKDYDTALIHDPNAQAVLLDRAKLYLQQKNYDAASEDCKKVLTMKPNKQAFLILGECAYQKKNYEVSIQWYNQCIKEIKFDEFTCLLRARSYIELKQYDKAIEDAFVVYPYKRHSTNVLYELNRMSKDSLDYVLAKLEEKSAADPNNPMWNSIAALLCIDFLKPYEAIDYYNKALNIKKDEEYYYGIVTAYNQLGDYDKALEYYDRAIENNPWNNTKVKYLKAEFLNQIGRYGDALKLLNEVIKESKNVEYYQERAESYIGLKNYSAALKDWNVAIENEWDLRSLLHRAEVYELMGNKKLAEADYNAVLNDTLSTSIYSNAWRAFACVGLGRNSEVKGYVDKLMAVDYDERSQNLLSRSDFPYICYNIACIYSRMGDCAESVSYLRKAYETGYRKFSHIEADRDFNNCINTAAMKDLINEFRPKKR